MKGTAPYIEKSFRKSLVVLGLVFISLISILISKINYFKILDLFIGLPILIASVFGIIGLIQGLKGLKEKRTKKMVFSLLINFAMVVAFVLMLISTIKDISQIEH